MREFRILFPEERAKEGMMRYQPLGTDERAARVQWENFRAEHLTRFVDEFNQPSRYVFQAREVSEWTELESFGEEADDAQ